MDHQAFAPELSCAALSVIDALATALAVDPGLDRAALVRALTEMQVCSVGYEQADSLWPREHGAVQAALVARLVDSLARA